MDEGGFNSDLWIGLGAALGVWRAFERHSYEDVQILFFRWLMLAQLAAVAGVQAETWRGFLYLTAMPIGCYKIAQIVASPIALWWQARRHASGSKPAR